MRLPDFQERKVRSFDGVELTYHVFGRGTPVLFCGGLGGEWRICAHQFAYLSDRYRFLTWPYRGLGENASAGADVAVATQARDALAILRAEQAEGAGLVAWSVGVQVAAEVFRLAGGNVRALVWINGLPGRPWDSLFDWALAGWAFDHTVRALQAAPGVLERLARRIGSWPETVEWTKRTGFASATLDDELFGDLARDFGALSAREYLRLVQAFGAHDASDMLDSIDVPALIIGGDRDRVTPRRRLERVVRSVRGAEYLLVPGATLYLPLEYPELVNLRIEKFFSEKVHTAPSAGVPPADAAE